MQSESFIIHFIFGASPVPLPLLYFRFSKLSCILTTDMTYGFTGIALLPNTDTAVL